MTQDENTTEEQNQEQKYIYSDERRLKTAKAVLEAYARKREFNNSKQKTIKEEIEDWT